jgi:hypothetical protein
MEQDFIKKAIYRWTSRLTILKKRKANQRLNNTGVGLFLKTDLLGSIPPALFFCQQL